jgi:polyhydroxybutyrate depolymerase
MQRSNPPRAFTRGSRRTTSRVGRACLVLAFIGLTVLLADGCGSAGTATATIRIPTVTGPTTGSTPGSPSTSTSTAARSFASGLASYTITVGGRERTYILYVPPGISKRHPVPLVLSYHGALDTAANTVTETDLYSQARAHRNMILAFMQGYDNTWNEDAGNTPAHAAGVNDVAFTTAVISHVEAGLPVDRHAVVATGISNGALLTELLGCRLASSISLIVPVEGQLPASVSPGCSPARPISVFEVHGTADATIPYGGGHFDGVGGGTTVLSATASVLRWATLDNCAAKTTSTSSGNSVLTHYHSCRDGVVVTLDTIKGGQHQWSPSFGQLISGVIAQLPS